MEDIAFRIEVLDGDSSREDDYQTRLEILPSPQDSPPRFILLSLDAFGGILPHMDTRGASARPDGVGYWRRDDAQWTYTSLERITTTWRYLQDTATFTKDLDTPLTCPSKDQTPSILEAYTTKSTRHRVGLILCATQADSDGTCSEDAQTQLLWVHLHRKRDEQLYSKRSELEVFDKPLSQCRRSAPKDKKACYPVILSTQTCGQCHGKNSSSHLARAMVTCVTPHDYSTPSKVHSWDLLKRSLSAQMMETHAQKPST